MSERFLQRMARAAEEAARRDMAALVITPSPDYRYLTGYEPPLLERLTALVIRPGADPVLVVPELEAPLAAASPVGGGVEVLSWRDGVDPYELTARLLWAGGEVGANDRMWASHLLELQRAAGGASFASAGAVLAPLRMRKDPEELELLSRAAHAADRAFARIREERLADRREVEVSRRLGELLVEEGHDRADFAIVASGANGASPHHDPGDRTIGPGDVVVMDFGGQLGGYFSDITRTVALAEQPTDAGEVHAIVREAQEAGFRAVGPGVPAQEVDRAVRRVIERAGYGDRFIHRTGHGIGLDVHEAPYIVEGNEETLADGMCFSIEPGVYLEGRFGVRIEDIVAVTGGGGRRLNEAPRELLVQ